MIGWTPEDPTTTYGVMRCQGPLCGALVRVTPTEDRREGHDREFHVRDKPLTIIEHDAAAAVRALDAIDADEDPEHAHGQADDILLALAHPAIQAAHKRLIDRAPWWAAS